MAMPCQQHQLSIMGTKPDTVCTRVSRSGAFTRNAVCLMLEMAKEKTQQQQQNLHCSSAHKYCSYGIMHAFPESQRAYTDSLKPTVEKINPTRESVL